ncbi:MAG TPA: hypothetical protein VE820_05335 [Sphingomicrobium sp.]|nr:hypothetical protein [Sphingomicrobium sp.]
MATKHNFPVAAHQIGRAPSQLRGVGPVDGTSLMSGSCFFALGLGLGSAWLVLLRGYVDVLLAVSIVPMGLSALFFRARD